MRHKESDICCHLIIQFYEEVLAWHGWVYNTSLHSFHKTLFYMTMVHDPDTTELTQISYEIKM